MDYAKSPSALFKPPIRAPARRRARDAPPLLRRRRAPGVAHLLLATRLVGTVFFAGLARYAILGAWHQDRKLLAAGARRMQAYLAVTSAVPFAAIVAAGSGLAWRRDPAARLVLGLGQVGPRCAPRTLRSSPTAGLVIGVVLAGAALSGRARVAAGAAARGHAPGAAAASSSLRR